MHLERVLNEIERPARPGFRRLTRPRRCPNAPERSAPRRRRVTVTEVFEPGIVRLFENGEPVAERRCRLLPDAIPVVHVQNQSQPFRYTGLGEVEPLVPLQDELNTRLSDRAARVTMQSFKMYLARGFDPERPFPVAPGIVWKTDNPDAAIESFGGDASSPSEDRHVDEIREAMDKISAVPPVAGGVVRAKIGNLSSATALRVTLLGINAKTERKRVAYGRGITRMCELVLETLDAARVLRTRDRDRALHIVWPDPLGLDEATDQPAPARRASA